MTVAVLLVRGTIRDDTAARPASATSPAPRAAPPPASPRRTTTAAPAPGAYHEIRAGDTLGGVADRYDTSVETLVELNPGIDPVALRVGARVRVK